MGRSRNESNFVCDGVGEAGAAAAASEAEQLQGSSSGRFMIKRKKSKKKFGAGGEAKAGLFRNQDEICGSATGRLVVNGTSKQACLFTQQGKKGTNQDAMLVWEVSQNIKFL